MGASTNKLGLYLPGGGSTGTITPDESADIDKINNNMQLLDAAAGFKVCTSTTRPTPPYDGQPIYETDTGKLKVYVAATPAWVDAVVVSIASTNITDATTVGKALLTAAAASNARTTLGVGAAGGNVFVAATAATGLAALRVFSTDPGAGNRQAGDYLIEDA